MRGPAGGIATARSRRCGRLITRHLGARACRVCGPLVDCGVDPHSTMRRLAVLASGQGTNFEALALAERRGELGGHVVALLSDRPDAPALDRARRLEVEALHVVPGRFRTRLDDESAWIEALRARDIDTVLLAGFLRRLHGEFLAAFPD